MLLRCFQRLESLLLRGRKNYTMTYIVVATCMSYYTSY